MTEGSKPPATGGNAFQFRDFRLYQSARLLVILGAEAQSVAVAWQVYQLTHSPLDLGYTGLALFLPGLFCVLPAGHIADRYDRRNIILLCYGMQLLCTFALLWFALYGTGPGHPVWPIYAVLCGIGMGRAFSGPASSAFLPSLVPPAHFVNAVTWGASIFQIANIAGPAVGGLLFTLPMERFHSRWTGAAVVYAFTILTLSAFLVLIGLIRARANVRESKAFDVRTMLAGLEYVWKTKLLLGSISLDLFAVLLGGATSLLPIFATDVLHAGPRGLGLLRAMPSLGALIVSITLLFRPLKRRAGKTMLVCVAIFGMATVVFGLSKNLWLSLAALITLGASDMISVVVRSSILQLATPPEMRGRVSAVNWLFIGASNEFGEFESGLTAQWLGAVRAVIIGGLGSMFVTGAAAVLFPRLRNADALTAEALMEAEHELSIAEPVN
ncbi:MAG TPA: MFS transporter [Granulicella sp.]